MNKIPLFFLFCAFFLFFTGSLAAESSLYMVLAIADDYEDPANNMIAPGVRADGRTLEQFGKLLQEYGVIKVEEPIIVSGRQLSKKNLLNQIKKIKVTSEDVFLVFFSGHGAVEGRPPRQILYACTGPNIYRDELDEAISSKKAKFSLLITDNCSVNLDNFRMAPSRNRKSTSVAIKNLTRLFNDYEGYLSISAATEGEVAFGPDSGGFFTTSLVKNVLISNPPDDWSKVMSQTKGLVNGLYDSLPASMKAENIDMFGQTNQNPKAYSLPVAGGGSSTTVTNTPNWSEGQSPAGVDITSYEPEKTEDGWEEGDDWWGQEAYDSEEWDEQEWDEWDDGFDDWGEDPYSQLLDMSDSEWEELFEQFMETLPDKELDSLSEEELYERFEEFLIKMMEGGV